MTQKSGYPTATRGSGRLKFVSVLDVIFVFGITDHVVSAGQNPRRTPADILHHAFFAAGELNKISDADRFLNQDMNTGKQVRQRILQCKSYCQTANT